MATTTMEVAVASGMGREITTTIDLKTPPSSSSTTSSSSFFSSYSTFLGGAKRGRGSRMQQIFDALDENKDEVITGKEISKAVNLMGMEVEMPEVESLVASYVRSGNEGLRYEDFVELCEWVGVGEDDEDEGFEESEVEFLSEAFKVFDEDGDGYISAGELQVVLEKLGFVEAREMDEVERMILNVDTNRDGRVDFFEFRDMMRNPNSLLSATSTT